MPTAEQIQQAITNVHDHQSFIQNLLIDTLGWQIPNGIEQIEDIAFGWTQEELGSNDLDQQLVDGQIFQIQSMIDTQPWGIFVLEFASEEVFTTGRGLTGPLRKVLRGLVPKRRRQANLPAWDRENLLFICTHNYEYFRFAYFKAQKEKTHAAPLTTFGWELGTPARTTYENLCFLEWPDDTTAEKWVSKWTQAFDVEKVTNKFYDDYERVFTNLQTQLDLPNDEDKKMFAQILMNRLMFLRFVERKGWLRLNDLNPKEYLKNLYQAGRLNNLSWYRSRLQVLFFEGLAVPDHNREDVIGSVPYLNGGLFTRTEWDERAGDIADEVFEPILGENSLLYRYNFTVEESTPLDIEVAVDPEMLGKVFEKLVTARRQQGSYYTPRTVVSFMCRESLKGYLGTNCTPLIDEHKNDNISVPQAKDLLAKLSELKVVDPACGSGAYLLGMLQELYTITELLDSRAEQATAHDSYQRKLQIIQNNIYGVDLDVFAVNIARLRLWLSLAVEFEDDTPDPLPNLDYKIETGDSLTAPDPSGGRQPDMFRQQQIREFDRLKALFSDPVQRTSHPDLDEQINQLRQEIAEYAHPGQTIAGFDWRVEFAEVFVNGGFDVVIANPPYGIRVDNSVRNQYFNQRNNDERGQSKDGYGIFMARGLQLLKPSGTMSYIVSDTWRTIKTHKPLRKRILDKTTIFHFLDLPAWIFDATVNTGIITFRRAQAPNEHKLIAGDLRGIEKGDWKSLSDNLIAVSGHGPDIQTINCARYTYFQNSISNYENLSFFIGWPNLYNLMSNNQFQKLGDISNVRVGLQTGDNRYYLRKHDGARGSYEIVNEAEILTNQEIAALSDDEKLNGVEPDVYAGRHFIPYDKGGESNPEGGWLPNYYVPTEYFIDWSRTSVSRLQADPRARFQNSQYYFQHGITFSYTGFYAPNFRLNSGAVFDVGGSSCFNLNMPIPMSLAFLASRINRYIAKVFVDHTVNYQVDEFKELLFPANTSEHCDRLNELVSAIIEKQNQEQYYLYYLYEQKEIDALVYELYGLDDEDICEVELWYCRRYSRLAEAQGVLAEAKEKYAGHLARCQRILEKPPSYWHSNPVLQLIAQGESHTLECKETLQYNIHTNRADNDVLHSSLKTIAAFLNTDGGTLLIGVSDSGEVKGIARDISTMGRNANNDRFELKIRDCISGQNSRFDPAATGNVNISFEELHEGTICRVDIQPLANTAVLNFDNEVYIRDGNRTIKLEGRALTDWIQQRNRHS